MEWILETLVSLQMDVQSAVASTSGSSSEEFIPRLKPVQLNDYVHVIHDPLPERRPSVEIVFFHGLQLERTKGAYLNTWLSRDGTQLWLNWILDEFPDARILTISYDAAFRRTDSDGIMDMFITGENLVTSLIDERAQIGQDGCPVLLVGHCVGGLVMKEICNQAHSVLSINSSYGRVQNFLRSIKGLFYYATPNHGTELAECSTPFPKGPLVEGLSILNKKAARRNHRFCMLRKQYGWEAFGVGEGREVFLGAFKGYFVVEASARYDVGTFYTVAANHFDVCRPDSRNSSSFRLLLDFVRDMVEKDKVRHGPKIIMEEEVIGLGSQINAVKRELRLEQRLGIIGIGGIGKTTLAKALYEAIKGNFEYTCFLEDVKRGMGRDEKPDDLRAKIIGNLYWRGRKVDHTFKWSKLKGQEVLIILDDVTSESQVLVMTQSDEFSKDSRVVVTSRDAGFLVRQKFSFHFAKTLNSNHSMRLFCLYAFETANAPSGYEERVERLTTKCGGLPLALKVAGGYLYKREYLWDDVLENLHRAQPLDGKAGDGLWSILRMSYDSLAPVEKQMFLDVATVLHGKRLDKVKQMWRTCGWSAESGWINLVDKGLVAKLPLNRIYDLYADSDDDEDEDDDCLYTIQMHDLLRDLGRSEACPDPAEHSRMIWDISASAQAQSSNQGAREKISKVEVLQISATSVMREDGAQPDTDFLRGMHKMRILLLESVALDAPHNQSFWACCICPRSLVHLSKTDTDLGTLGEYGSDHSLEKGQGLQYLEIFRCFCRSLPTFVGQLQGLKHLAVEDCRLLQALPPLRNLHSLQHLRLAGCSDLESLPESLGLLRSLQDLTILSCSDLEFLPQSLGKLQTLQHLRLTRCRRLKSLPDSLGRLRSLQHLRIEKCPLLKSLPESLGLLRSLQHLTILSCNMLKSLPQSLGDLQTLQHVLIKRCSDLESLPESLGLLRSLQHLAILSCDMLKSLPQSLGDLQTLQHLLIKRCSDLESLPESLGCLESLEFLAISYCTNLKHLPDSLWQLRALKCLTLDCRYNRRPGSELTEYNNTSSLDFRSQALSDALGKLQGLQHLQLCEWDASFSALPEALGQLRALVSLQIENYWSLRTLPDTLGDLKALKSLRLWNCPKLESLPNSVGNLKRLEFLTVISCTALSSLPPSLGELRALKYLHLRDCGDRVPDILRELQVLKTLTLEDFRYVPDSIRGLEALETLELRMSNDEYPDINSESHAALDCLGQLATLEERMIDFVEALPDGLGQLHALQRLTIKGNNLRALPETLVHLQALEHLCLRDCDSLCALPDAIGELKSLKKLELYHCGRLQMLPDSLGQCESLERVEVHDCRMLRYVPGSIKPLLIANRCPCLL